MLAPTTTACRPSLLTTSSPKVGGAVVSTIHLLQRPAQWGGAHVTIQYANGEGLSLAKCWRNDAPRREPRTLTTTWTKSKLSITGAGVETGEPTEEKETSTLEADSPEECDAWDVWVEELKSVRELLRNAWTAAETVPV